MINYSFETLFLLEYSVFFIFYSSQKIFFSFSSGWTLLYTGYAVGFLGWLDEQLL